MTFTDRLEPRTQLKMMLDYSIHIQDYTLSDIEKANPLPEFALGKLRDNSEIPPMLWTHVLERVAPMYFCAPHQVVDEILRDGARVDHRCTRLGLVGKEILLYGDNICDNTGRY